MGSVVAVGGTFFFLSTFRCERPFLKRRNDSRRDFLKDFRRDIGLSSALAMSAKMFKIQFEDIVVRLLW